jgi:hypothetical protein
MKTLGSIYVMIKSEKMDLKFLGQEDMRLFPCLFVQSPFVKGLARNELYIWRPDCC